MKPPQYDFSWNEEVKALYNHDIQEIWDPTICRNVWNQYHNQLDTYLSLVNTLSQGKRLSILDVGCAQATLAILLVERGHRVHAVDIRPQFLEYAKTRYTHGDIHFVCGNIFDLSFDEDFDIVIANQIVEHLVYPQRLFEHLRDYIAAKGHLIVTTPNHEYLVSTLPSFGELGDLSVHESKQFTADADGHFFAYRASELLEIMKAAGFENTQATFFESPFVSGHMRVRYLHRFTPVKLLRLLDTLLLRTLGIGRKLAHQLMVVGEKR